MTDLGKTLTERMTNAERDQTSPNSVPRDAATLILIDRAGPDPKVLLGRRHAGHKFMPGKFVFPGGRIEKADALMTAATELHPAAEAKLAIKPRDAEVPPPRAFVLAAVRETFEETGLMIGVRRDDAPSAPGGPWAAFAEAKVHPDLSTIHFIARAVTPPRRSRRYDTRFFTSDASAIAHKIDGAVGPDSELVELVWMPLDEAKTLDLLAITELVLEDLQTQIDGGFSHDLPVPFYRLLRGKRLRSMI